MGLFLTGHLIVLFFVPFVPFVPFVSFVPFVPFVLLAGWLWAWESSLWTFAEPLASKVAAVFAGLYGVYVSLCTFGAPAEESSAG